MNHAVTIAAALLLASATAQAVAPAESVAELKQQLADSEELASGMRDQIDETINRAEAAEAKAEQLQQEITVLRQQRDATQTRLAELQRRAQEAPVAPRVAAGPAAASGKLAELTAANKRADADIAFLRGEIFKLQQELAAAKRGGGKAQAAESARQADELKAARIEATELRRQLAEAQAMAVPAVDGNGELPELRSQLEAARRELAQARADSIGNAESAAAFAAEAKQAQEKAASLQAELASAQQEQAGLPELRAQLEAARNELAQARADSQRNAESATAFAAELGALQAKLATLQQERDEARAQANAKAQQDQAELPKLREQLAAAVAARDSAATDARNLAAELRTTRADRDKYQRSSIENAERNARLLEQLSAAINGSRSVN
jgi:chromosome segregation ATPase